MSLKSFLSVFLTFVLSCGFQATALAQAESPPIETEKTVENPAAKEETPPADASDSSKTVELDAKTETKAWPSFEKAFESGVKSYREKKYDEARLAFSDAVNRQPENVQALTNLALVQFQLDQKGWAVALLRKAHNLDPDFSTTAAALDFILPQLDIKEVPHEIQLWETIRTNFVVPFSLNGFLALTALTLFAAGWLMLRYLGRRREANRSEKAPPPFPTIPVLISLMFVCFLTLTILKFIDLGIPRGTIVSEKVTVYSAPGEKSVALFDLYAGLEVILKNSSEQWIQVTYPGASTGWVPKDSLLQTSGRNL